MTIPGVAARNRLVRRNSSEISSFLPASEPAQALLKHYQSRITRAVNDDGYQRVKLSREGEDNDV
jgi:hypothetical protein